MEVPATTSGRTPYARSSRKTPICAHPRAAPAPSANPILSFLGERAVGPGVAARMDGLSEDFSSSGAIFCLSHCQPPDASVNTTYAHW